MKSFAIVGSGAVGAYYGARLARVGEDVRFLLRRDLEVVRREGLRVRTPEEEFVLEQPRVAGTTVELGPVDVVIVALKTTANAALRVLLPPLLHEGTAILTLQNGLGVEEFLAGHFGAERVLGGLCFVCLNRTAPGVIENYLPGSVVLGEFGRPAGERLHALAERFRGAGVKTVATDNLAEARWKKLVWNIPFNGLAIAAGGLTTDRILADAGLRALVRELMEEVREGAAALGHHIPAQFADHQLERTYPMGPYKPSSLIDWLEGREVEVESIWGEPLRRARAAGAPLPRLATLYALLRALATRRRSGAEGRGD
jgi:2-dehydropantoate 2-reductase